jgi:hypothetical protein
VKRLENGADRAERLLPFHSAWELFWTCGAIAAFYPPPERTIFCAASLDEADAKRLVDYLRRRLPFQGRAARPLPRQLFP